MTFASWKDRGKRGSQGSLNKDLSVGWDARFPDSVMAIDA